MLFVVGSLDQHCLEATAMSEQVSGGIGCYVFATT